MKTAGRQASKRIDPKTLKETTVFKRYK